MSVDTNERSHRCNLCGAKFTRSDVLSRHKKTCRDPMLSSRSRQKSCQACASSKVKCDLEYPCSRCVSRHETCIFLNNPAVSREKRRNAKECSMSSRADHHQSTTESVYGSSISSTPSPTSEDALSPTFYITPITPDLGVSDLGQGVFISIDGHLDPYPHWPSSISSGEYMDFSWLGSDNGSGDDDRYYSSVPLSVVVPHCASSDTRALLPYLDPTQASMSVYDDSVVSSTNNV
ncbi:hypothetical protein DFS33DRAFT_1379350 [Desarmillaria ectypa]|nr:hypothetical protein DFS33DRAFT_1379350 [Desarmillaria ectypa]